MINLYNKLHHVNLDFALPDTLLNREVDRLVSVPIYQIEREVDDKLEKLLWEYEFTHDK